MIGFEYRHRDAAVIVAPDTDGETGLLRVSTGIRAAPEGPRRRHVTADVGLIVVCAIGKAA